VGHSGPEINRCFATLRKALELCSLAMSAFSHKAVEDATANKPDASQDRGCFDLCRQRLKVFPGDQQYRHENDVAREVDPIANWK
jgi:hypothetical protein